MLASSPSGVNVLFVGGNAINPATQFGGGGRNGTAPTPTFVLWSIQQTYDFSRTLVFDVTSPSSGGVVGTTKISDNNSPIPRDRVIFDYDFYSNVPLNAAGADVHRMSAGFEKTFLDGWGSVQLRVPFTSTLSSNSAVNGISNRDVELGDVHLTLKALFYRRQNLNLATGLGIALPTASDTLVRNTDGSDFIRIKNQSVILTPYVAGLWTPNDRFFAQVWGEVNFDASGSPVYANPNLNGLANVGRLRDQNLLQLDAQIGYWLIRDNTGQSRLSGMAPFLELHYNTPLNNAQLVQAGGFAIGSATNRYNELNIGTGLNFLFNNRLNILSGLIVPVNGPGNKFFDYQIGVRANWLFGATTRQSVVSNY